jgi:hypothetical protein
VSEPQASLFEPQASKKKEKRSGIRGGSDRRERVGVRAKRIKIKMVRSTNAGRRSIKRVLLGLSGWETGV